MARTFRKFEKQEKSRKLKSDQNKKYSVKRKALFNLSDDDLTE
jgi:hypothetical protein